MTPAIGSAVKDKVFAEKKAYAFREAKPASAPKTQCAPFPWEEAIAFGLGVLRLPPDAFWRMTPRELAHAVRAVCGGSGGPAAAPTRASLFDLMTRFPDG